MDNMGDYIAYPRNKKHLHKYAKHMKQWTGHYDGSAFFQEGGAAADLLETLSSEHHRAYLELKRNDQVDCILDPWLYGMWLGWDAHEVKL